MTSLQYGDHQFGIYLDGLEGSATAACRGSTPASVRDPTSRRPWCSAPRPSESVAPTSTRWPSAARTASSRNSSPSWPNSTSSCH